MFIDQLIREARRLERERHELREWWHQTFRHHAYKTTINFQFNNFKTSFTMGALTVPSGTPVTGSASPLDVKGNVLKIDAFKPQSCKWTTDSKDFDISQGPNETQFSIVENVPGAASQGNIFFDAQDANGNQLPQSSALLTFTAVVPVAVASVINFDQTTH